MATTGDKRRAPRLHHEIPVSYRSVGSFLSDWATDISQGGLFINTRAPLAIGTPVRILIQLPGEPRAAELDGTVTRIATSPPGAGGDRGMAVQFTGVGAERRAELERFVARLRRDLDEP